MDYIREELLRQQVALAALLLGKAAEEETVRDEETAGGEWPTEVSTRKSPAAAAAELETENVRGPEAGAAGTEAILLAGPGNGRRPRHRQPGGARRGADGDGGPLGGHRGDVRREGTVPDVPEGRQTL